MFTKMLIAVFVTFIAVSAGTTDEFAKLKTMLTNSIVNYEVAGAGDECAQCQAGVRRLDAFLEDPETKSMIRTLIDSVCDSLDEPNLDKVMCKIAANGLMPSLMKQLEKDVFSEWCTKDTCNAGTVKKFSICGVIQKLKNNIEGLTDLLCNLCTDLGAKLGADCQKLVTKIVPPIQKALTSMVSFVLKMLKCPTKADHGDELAGGDIKCEACNDGIKLLNDLLQSPLVKGSIIKLLQGLCLELPAGYANGCVETVATAITDIINFITDMTDHICPDLVHCASKQFVLSEAAQCNAADLECKTCNGLHSIYNYVGNLTGHLSGVCASLKNVTQRTNCINLFAKETASVVKFGQRIVAWTAAHVPLVPACKLGTTSLPNALPNGVAMGIIPHLVAQFNSVAAQKEAAAEADKQVVMRQLQQQAVVGVNGVKVAVPHQELAINNSVIECKACDDAIGFLNYLLGSPFVEGSLKTLLSGLCQELPPAYSTGCTQTVDGSLDQIVKFIADMDGQICPGALGCASKKVIFYNRFALLHRTKSTNAVCDAFQKIYDYVPKMTTELEGVCDVIPPQYAAGCKQFFATDSAAVTHMAQEAVQWVADKVPLAHCQVGPQQQKSIVSGA